MAKKWRLFLDEQMRPQLIRFLQRPGGKELVYELPKGAIDNLTKVFDPITEAFPIFKPGIEIMKSMVNEALKQRLKAKIEHLVTDASKNPASLDHSLPTVSRDLAADARPDVTPKVHQQFNHELAKLRQEITEMKNETAKLETLRPAAQPRAHPIERAAIPRANLPQGVRERPPDIPIRPRALDVPIRSRAPYTFPDRPFDPSPPSGGGVGGSTQYTYTSSCTCNHYVNGALVSSVPIPVGARCGAQVCGTDIPIR